MRLKRYPGLIDPHVHLREPGATHKEDFDSGSRAAVAGGITFMLDMPNNPEPTITMERLLEKVRLSEGALCDIGFNFGTNGHNLDQFADAAAHPKVFGLKLYCNHTTGQMLIEDLALLEGVYAAWPAVSGKPILVHAEGVQLAAALGLAEAYGQRLHVCHITQKMEVDLVRQAKSKGIRISAGVTPHHLYLTGEARERLGGYAIMKPPLGTPEDQAALWEGLKDGTIDLVETDHAPHTKEEKEVENPAFGVTGLETSFALMRKAVADGKISEERLIEVMHDAPKRVFSIPDQPDTYVEVDMDATTVVGADGYQSKAKWSPFDGMELPGRVITVILKGKPILENGHIL